MSINISSLDLSLPSHVIGSAKRGGVVQQKTGKEWKSIFYGTYWECHAFDAELERMKKHP